MTLYEYIFKKEAVEGGGGGGECLKLNLQRVYVMKANSVVGR